LPSAEGARDETRWRVGRLGRHYGQCGPLPSRFAEWADARPKACPPPSCAPADGVAVLDQRPGSGICPTDRQPVKQKGGADACQEEDGRGGYDEEGPRERKEEEEEGEERRAFRRVSPAGSRDGRSSRFPSRKHKPTNRRERCA